MVSHSVVTNRINYHSHDVDCEPLCCNQSYQQLSFTWWWWLCANETRVYHCNGTSDWPAPTHSWECYVPNEVEFRTLLSQSTDCQERGDTMPCDGQLKDCQERSDTMWCDRQLKDCQERGYTMPCDGQPKDCQERSDTMWCDRQLKDCQERGDTMPCDG